MLVPADARGDIWRRRAGLFILPDQTTRRPHPRRRRSFSHRSRCSTKTISAWMRDVSGPSRRSRSPIPPASSRSHSRRWTIIDPGKEPVRLPDWKVIDPEWVQAGTRRYVSYTNLDPAGTFSVFADPTVREFGAKVQQRLRSSCSFLVPYHLGLYCVLRGFRRAPLYASDH